MDDPFRGVGLGDRLSEWTAVPHHRVVPGKLLDGQYSTFRSAKGA